MRTLGPLKNSGERASRKFADESEQRSRVVKRVDSSHEGFEPSGVVNPSSHIDDVEDFLILSLRRPSGEDVAQNLNRATRPASLELRSAGLYRTALSVVK